MSKLFLAFVFMMGCHGSCSPREAMQQAVGPGSVCYYAGDSGVCIKQNTLYGCNVVGAFTNDAECKPLGLIKDFEFTTENKDPWLNY